MVAIVKFKGKIDLQKIRRAVNDANIESLTKAGAMVRKFARNRIRNRPSGKKRGRKKQIGQAQRENFLRKLREEDPTVLEAIEKARVKKRDTRPRSKPGSPPFTGNGRLMRRSILFEVSDQRDDVIIGTTATKFDQIGKRHEFGGVFDGKKYPKRPFMRPALDEVRSRLPRMWARSVKS